MIIDIRTFNVISLARNIINDGIYRLSNVATSPIKAFGMIGETSRNVIFTFKENKILKNELEQLRNKDFQVEYLKSQNEFLKRTLEKDKLTEFESVIAKVLLDNIDKIIPADEYVPKLIKECILTNVVSLKEDSDYHYEPYK